MGYLNCGKLDLRDVSEDDKVITDNYAWVAADVAEKIYYYNQTPCCILTIGQAVYATVCDESSNVNEVIGFASEVGQIFNDNPTGGSSVSPEDATGHEAKTNSQSATNGADKAETGVDASSMNAYGFMPSCVLPSAAAIPMRSNIRTYGPYTSSNFASSGGGTNVEKNTDLSPWTYNGWAGLHNAGITMANSQIADLYRTETGSATIPGYPDSSLQFLGAALSSVGACLTDLNFSYGSSGVTTSYQFKTYTPKAGSLTRQTLERLKTVSKYRSEQIRALRSQQIDVNRVGRKLTRFAKASAATISRKTENDKGARKQASLQRLLIGSSTPWEELPEGGRTTRLVVGTSDLRKSVAEMRFDFGKKAYMSLDGFFSPVSKAGSGGLSSYASYSGGHSTAAAQPPMKKQDGATLYNLSIDRGHLDPLTGPGAGHYIDGGTTKSGHTIEIVGRGDEVASQGVLSSTKRVSDTGRYSGDYRFFALRGPLVLQQWGYDTDGKPVPNAVDIEADAVSGNFKRDQLKDEFMPNWLAKSHTWPVAPIDLRFDRKRGVWTAPPQLNMLTVTLKTKLERYGSATAEVSTQYLPSVFDKDGNRITNTNIQVFDRLGQSLAAGSKIHVQYDTVNNQYFSLGGGDGSSGSEIVRFRLACTDPTAGVNYGDAFAKQHGYGDKPPNGHFMGVRINCGGSPVNSSGLVLNQTALATAYNNPSLPESSGVFINLLDTVGRFGSSYGYWSPSLDAAGYNKWVQRAGTGFAVNIGASESCALGSSNNCSIATADTYEILFLEGYARFIYGTLKQDLYAEEDAYPEDTWKTGHPNGNATITVANFWGGPNNGLSPHFANQQNVVEIDVRVYDPYDGVSDSKNQNLKEGEQVLAVFDETKKKYYIYDHAHENNIKVTKFALVDSWKGPKTTSFRAVRINCQGYPIDEKGEELTSSNFAEHIITVRDSSSINNEGFGPAAGSDSYQSHIDGITAADGNKYYRPFRGFALEAHGCFDCIYMQSFANYIRGRVGTTKPIDDYYYGSLEGWTDGVHPIGLYTDSPLAELPMSVINYKNITAGGDYVGGFYTQATPDFGCEYIAVLDKAGSGDGTLRYSMVNSQQFAKRLNLSIKTLNDVNDLNMNGYVRLANDGARFFAEGLEGFLWDPNGQQSYFEKTLVFNKNQWTNRALVIPWNQDITTITCDLVGYNPDTGELNYVINDAATIAQVGNGRVFNQKLDGGIIPPSRISGTQITKSDYQAASFPGLYYHGIAPSEPNTEGLYSAINFSTSTVWMTTSASQVYYVWNDTTQSPGSTEIDDTPHYEIINATEAPVIITGKAQRPFRPASIQCNVVINATMDIGSEILAVPGFSSHAYGSANPVPALLATAKNPLGYGANSGDMVTLQRVSIDDKRFSSIAQGLASYFYIVIGTGAKPPSQ
jgi:hypothetical protein